MQEYSFRRSGVQAAILLGGLAGGLGIVSANAQTQGGVPDAQVEANVLRQLATAPELSSQNIQSTTVYGTVTLSGSVHSEAMRTKAENLAARAQGVKKVVDQLSLGDSPAPQQNGDPNAQYAQTGDPAQGAPAPGQVLQSDGTYAPAQGDNSNSAPSPAPGYPGAPEYSNGGPAQPQPQPGYQNQQPAYQQPGYQAQPYPNQQPYPNEQQAYGSAPPPPPNYPQRQPLYSNGGPGGPNGYAQYPPGSPQAGQVGGQVVTVAPGALLQVRLDRGFDANHVQPGTAFSGVVMQDVVANGAVAIPRGAPVQGTVVDAKKAGALKGEAQLGLAITGLTLGGQNYTLASDIWQREGRDKTGNTVGNAVGLGAVGAIIGAVAGGGAGAAIGGAVGAGAGVAGSAASPGGRVIVPAEAVLTFRLSQPTTITTVGQAELARLSYAAGPGPRPVPPRRYYSPYGYYGPGPGYYR